MRQDRERGGLMPGLLEQAGSPFFCPLGAALTRLRPRFGSLGPVVAGRRARGGGCRQTCVERAIRLMSYIFADPAFFSIV